MHKQKLDEYRFMAFWRGIRKFGFDFLAARNIPKFSYPPKYRCTGGGLGERKKKEESKKMKARNK